MTILGKQNRSFLREQSSSIYCCTDKFYANEKVPGINHCGVSVSQK